MEQRLGLDISKGYPTMDEFFTRKKEIVLILGGFAMLNILNGHHLLN